MIQVYNDDLFKFCLFLLYFLLLNIQFVLHCIAEKIPEKSKYNIGVVSI